MNRLIVGLVVSTIAYFVASHYIKRHLDEAGIPKSMVRGVVVFALAVAVSYAVAYVIDWVARLLG